MGLEDLSMRALTQEHVELSRCSIPRRLRFCTGICKICIHGLTHVLLGQKEADSNRMGGISFFLSFFRSIKL